MLLLAATTDKLQLVTGQAVTVDVHSSFMDMTTADPPVVKGSTSGNQNTAITTAATTDIVAAPAASTRRNIKNINIRNKHATDSVTVTVVFDANGTDYELHKVTLAAGEALIYSDELGTWFTLGAANPTFVKSLAADFNTSSATPGEVTGLSLATATGTFKFEYLILHQSAATTTGTLMSVNYDGTVTAFVYWQEYVTALTTASNGVQDQDVALTTGGLICVNAARAKGTAGIGASVSVDTANADMLTIIRGLAIVTVAGNFEFWYASEVAAASTVKAGSSLILTKTG